jgi:integrase
MSLYKRKAVWWVRFTAPNGQRIRCSTGTSDRAQAQEYHDQLKAEYWRTAKLGQKPKRTWQEAVIRWLKETDHKATHEMDKLHLRWLDPYLREMTLDEITRDVIDRIKESKKAEGVTNGTVNRMLALLRAILRRAETDWEWLDQAPKVRLLPEPKRRIRWLNREMAERLLAELPKHLEIMARFTLATGLRQGNVKGLVWSQVDLERRMAWIHPDQAKARKAIAVPLNADAIGVLREQLGVDPEYVFTYRGKPITQVNTKAWKTALERAGIEDFRWHDLRHTWASWHVQQGTPLHVLQELGGWETADMVRRYAHLTCEHTAHYAERLSQINPKNDRSAGTNLAQQER